MALIIGTGCFFISCQKTENTVETMDCSTYLSLDKPDFDFAHDWDGLSETDKKIYRDAKKRMDITFDQNGICTTKWMSGSQINISEKLFEYFISMINFTNEATEKLFELEGDSPRLKSGIESNTESRSNNCLVQCLIHVLGTYNLNSGPYHLSAIDSWIANNNYYSY
jgi:hypothetical protein